MAKAARAAAAPLLTGLLDEITVWVILVRLPPKALLRCRAVCRAWRRATSARDFLLAHHARQPALPLACGLEYYGGHCFETIATFDHRAAAPQLQTAARLFGIFALCPSCDGLLILYSTRGTHFFICNPTTRQCAPLPQLSGFVVLGMYVHGPTGEYRILVYSEGENPATDGHDAYIFALGSVQPPRNVGWLKKMSFGGVTVLFRGRLHWHLNKCDSTSSMIMVFSTTAETFHQMPSPTASGFLFEMDGVFGVSSFIDEEEIVNIWVLQDYESEVWTFKCRVRLPLAEIRLRCEKRYDFYDVVVLLGDGKLLVLVKYAEWLFQVDMDGKLVTTTYSGNIAHTQFQLKQSLVPHAFFPTLEGYAVNDLPFIWC